LCPRPQTSGQDLGRRPLIFEAADGFLFVLERRNQRTDPRHFQKLPDLGSRVQNLKRALIPNQVRIAAHQLAKSRAVDPGHPAEVDDDLRVALFQHLAPKLIEFLRRMSQLRVPAKLQHRYAARVLPFKIRRAEIRRQMFADPQFIEAFIAAEVVSLELLDAAGIKRPREISGDYLFALYGFLLTDHFSIYLVLSGRGLFHFRRVGTPETFFCAKQNDPKLGICHVPLLADLFLILPVEVQRPEYRTVAFREFLKTVIYGIAHLQNIGFRPYPDIRHGNVRVSQRLTPHPPPIFENDISANAIQECTAFFRISNCVFLRRSKKSDQTFLNQVVHIGAIIPNVIQNLVAQLKAQALNGNFVQVQGTWLGDRVGG
jgi:hypothetical protein